MPPETEQSSEQGNPSPPKPGRLPWREFLQARWQLLTLEAREATQVLTVRVAAIAAAAIAAFLAWALLLVAVGWALHHFLDSRMPEEQAHWAGPAAAGILFLIHLIAVLVLVGIARRKPSPPLFECSREEWKKDQAWLHKENSSDKNAN